MFPVVGYMLLFVAVGAAFILVNLLVGKLIRPVRPHQEKETIYECGEPTIGSAWVQFDLRYYVIALLFVIFDVEVAFFFPWAVVFGKANELARADLDPKVKNVLLHLQLRGASFAQDLARGAGLDTAGTLASLWELFWAGLVTPDTFSAIVAGSAPSRPEAPRPAHRGRRPRRGARRAPLARLPVIGRWSVLAEEEALSPAVVSPFA